MHIIHAYIETISISMSISRSLSIINQPGDSSEGGGAHAEDPVPWRGRAVGAGRTGAREDFPSRRDESMGNPNDPFRTNM